MGLLNLLGSDVLEKITDIVKVFVGSKSERDAAIAEEVKAIQETYKAELLAPEKIGLFARFVDGINRLVRPLFTYGILALFIWAVYNPISFTSAMVALSVVPETLFYIMGGILGFWFGGRAITDIKGVKPLSKDQLLTLLATQKKLLDVAKQETKPEVLIEANINTNEPVPVVEEKETTSNKQKTTGNGSNIKGLKGK